MQLILGKFVACRRGTTMVEYAMLLGLSGVFAFGAFHTFQGFFTRIFSQIGVALG